MSAASEVEARDELAATVDEGSGDREPGAVADAQQQRCRRLGEDGVAAYGTCNPLRWDRGSSIW